MTKEEKAKAYDEALERAKCEIDTKGIGDTVELCKSLFPELRESEDERIRKGLEILVQNAVYPGLITEQESKNYLDYLEKLKEEEGYEAIPVKSTFEYKLGFADGRDSERQKEQKFSELSANDKAFIKDCARILDENYYTENAERLLSMFPVKPAEWSEKEFGMLFDIEHYLNGTLQLTPDRKIKCISFLKSLRPQPKQQWSEEDKAHMLSLLMRLDGMCKSGATFTQTRFAVSEDMAWIRSLSLRQRSFWKPSKMQLTALDNARHANGNHSLLDSLYDDLKKLM